MSTALTVILAGSGVVVLFVAAMYAYAILQARRERRQP